MGNRAHESRIDDRGNCQGMTVVFVNSKHHFKGSDMQTRRWGYNFYNESEPTGTLRASN